MSDSIWGGAYDAVLEKAMRGQYDESKHPRHAKGSGRNAGQFAPKGGGGATVSPATALAYKKSLQALLAHARKLDAKAKHETDEETRDMFATDAEYTRDVAAAFKRGDIDGIRDVLSRMETSPREDAFALLPMDVRAAVNKRTDEHNAAMEAKRNKNYSEE